MLKKAVMLVSGNAFGSALLLFRNLVVAWLVSPEDYGIASTLAVAMSIVEMLSYIGLNQMIVIDEDGDNPDVQRAMQGFQVMRGFFASALLFAIAHPYARFLGIDEVAWAYQVMAAIPLINGFQHFDTHRQKRHLNFRPAIVAQAVPPLISVLSLWPLALWFGDFRIMLFALMVQAVSMVVLSHLMAERPYRLSFDFALIRRATVFGWPLLMNGVLLFGVFNGERMIVGRELGMSQLAVFSMAITLTMTPTLVMAGAAQSLFLPQLSAARDRRETFQWLARSAVESTLAFGVLLLLGTVLVGGPIVHLLLGPKYAHILDILVPMAVVQSLRVAKGGASTVALSTGRSGNAMVSNVIRVLSLPISWWVLIQGGGILSVLYIAAAAEAIGYVVALQLASRRSGLPIKPVVLPSVLAAAACIAALIEARESPPTESWADAFQWSRLLVAGLCLAALGSMSALKGYVMRRLRRR